MHIKNKWLLSTIIIMLVGALCAVGTFRADAIEDTQDTQVLSGSCGETATWKIENDTLTISGTGVVSDYVAGEAPWFPYRSNFKTLQISEGITRVGVYAFYACSGIESVYIPASLTEIGGSAFTSCSAITGVYITDIKNWCHISFEGGGDSSLGWGDSFRANPLYVGEAAKLYLNDELVTDLVIPEGTTRIESSAFCGCSHINSVTIPKGLQSTGWYSFSDCEIEAVYVPDLETWCNITFGPFTFHAEDSAINAKKMYVNGELVTDIVIPDTVTTIKAGAFIGFDEVNSITIPASVTEIEEKAFYSCKANKIIFSEGLQVIGNRAFAQTKQELFILPKSVYSVGESAFYGYVAFSGMMPEFKGSCGDVLFYPYGDNSWSSLSGNVMAWHPDKGELLDHIEAIADVKAYSYDNSQFYCDGIYLHCKECDERLQLAGRYSCYMEAKEIVQEPTCETEGKMTYLCSRWEQPNDRLFNVEVTVTIPVKDHTEQVIPGKEATCIEPGLTEGKMCADCGKELVKQNTTALARHKEKILPSREATCTQTGLTQGKMCAVCGEELVQQEWLPKTQHTEKHIPAKEATCTEDGLTEGCACAVCGKELVKQEVIKAAHIMGAWSVTEEPTEKEPGQRSRACSVCGMTETKEVAQLTPEAKNGWVVVLLASVGGVGVGAAVLVVVLKLKKKKA